MPAVWVTAEERSRRSSPAGAKPPRSTGKRKTRCRSWRADCLAWCDWEWSAVVCRWPWRTKLAADGWLAWPAGLRRSFRPRWVTAQPKLFSISRYSWYSCFARAEGSGRTSGTALATSGAGAALSSGTLSTFAVFGRTAGAGPLATGAFGAFCHDNPMKTATKTTAANEAIAANVPLSFQFWYECFHQPMRPRESLPLEPERRAK